MLPLLPKGEDLVDLSGELVNLLVEGCSLVNGVYHSGLILEQHFTLSLHLAGAPQCCLKGGWLLSNDYPSNWKDQTAQTAPTAGFQALVERGQGTPAWPILRGQYNMLLLTLRQPDGAGKRLTSHTGCRLPEQ